MRRTWQDGDTIEVDMPMSFRTEAFADDARRVALMYGPLVMAAVTDAGNHFSAIRDLGGDLCASLTSIPGRTLCFSAPAALFRTSPLGPASSPLEVRPLLSLIAEPYAVYWRLRTDEELAAAALPYRREAEPRRPSRRIPSMRYGPAIRSATRRRSGRAWLASPGRFRAAPWS